MPAVEEARLSFLDTEEVRLLLERIHQAVKPKDATETKNPAKSTKEKGKKQNKPEQENETSLETLYRLFGLKTGKNADALHREVFKEETQKYGLGYPSVIREIYRIKHNLVDTKEEMLTFLRTGLEKVIIGLNKYGNKFFDALASAGMTGEQFKDYMDRLLESFGVETPWTTNTLNEKTEVTQEELEKINNKLNIQIEKQRADLTEAEVTLALAPYNLGKDVEGWNDIVAHFLYGELELKGQELANLEEQLRKNVDRTRTTVTNLVYVFAPEGQEDAVVSFGRVLSLLVVFLGGQLSIPGFDKFNENMEEIDSTRLYYCDSCKFNKEINGERYCIHPSPAIKIQREEAVPFGGFINSRHIPFPYTSYCTMDFIGEKENEDETLDSEEGLTIGWSIFDDDGHFINEDKVGPINVTGTEIDFRGNNFYETEPKGIADRVIEKAEEVEKELKKVFNKENKREPSPQKKEAFDKAKGESRLQE
jgi:hypothetical protein